MNISREFHFSSGHTLTNYDGKCANLHGHNYKVVIEVGGNLDSLGMVVDFGLIKTEFNALVDEVLDHRFIINQSDPRMEALRAIETGLVVWVGNPTAESIANWILFRAWSFHVASVMVWETESAYAKAIRNT
jgi:6-pyruvoyltetrahydropterin/6-carboxytetrahydropterin synthase